MYSMFRIVYVSLLIMIPAYFLSMQFEGQAVQQTILLQNIVLGQAVYMLNCRELLEPALNKSMFRNRALFISRNGSGVASCAATDWDNYIDACTAS